MNYNQKVETRSLYIHWPFCPYKCHFCPFVALASHDQFMEQYHNALIKEINNFVLNDTKKQSLDTIFIGGGTPSTYPDNLLLDMFGTLNNRFIISPETEVTIEVNPGTVRIEQLALWKRAGINRLSIGVQGLNDAVLKGLNRHQSRQDVDMLLESARTMFDNISVDLILGLPGISPQAWKDTIHAVGQWPINHVSVYFLTVHEETPLYFGVKTNKISLPCDEEIVELYHWTIKTLQEYGLNQYEISNFARTGFESRHNTVYWERKPYKAFGLGACSFDGNQRLQNEKNLMRYINNIEQGLSVTTFSETLSQEQVFLEKIMLGLRRAQGIPYADVINGITTEGRKELVIEKIHKLEQDGLLLIKDEKLILTPMGLAVQNEVVTQFCL